MRKLCVLFSVVATFLAVMALAVLCIQIFAFDSRFYADEYAKYDTASYVGVESRDLNAATDVLLSYIEDKRGDLDLTVNIGGEQRQYYNEREKAHMVDVKNLYLSAVNFAIYGSIAACALFAACFLIMNKKALRAVLFGIYNSAYVILAGFAILAAWAASDFDGFWTRFHMVFFRNDLWILDPRTDLMIRMFQSGFFFDLVLLILLLFFGIFIPATIAAKLVHKRLVKNEL